MSQILLHPNSSDPAPPATGDLLVYATNSSTLAIEDSDGVVTVLGSTANVSGPVSSVDRTVAIFNGTAGNEIEDTGVVIDADNNIFGNNCLSKSASTISSAGTIIMTAASAGIQVISGATTEAFNLPQATTLPQTGYKLEFNNNSTGAVTLYLHDGSTQLIVIPPGAYAEVICIDNSSSNGTWDYHWLAPKSAAWGTLGLQPNVGGTGKTTYTEGDMLYSPSTNNLSALAIGSTGQFLQVTAGVPTWGPSPGTDPSAVMQWVDDFDGVNNPPGTLNWSNNDSGGICGLGGVLDNAHIGLVRFYANGNGNYGGLYKDVSYVFGGGQVDLEFLITTDTVATSGTNYLLQLGFMDAFGGSAPSNGAWFSYTQGVNSTQWVCNVAAGGTTTSANTTVPVTINTWTKFHITVDAAAANVYFYIDGTLVATITTNIPTTASHKFGLSFGALGTAGNSFAVTNMDYVWYKQVFTTPR